MTTKPQNHKTTKPQNHKTTKPQNHKTTKHGTHMEFPTIPRHLVIWYKIKGLFFIRCRAVTTCASCGRLRCTRGLHLITPHEHYYHIWKGEQRGGRMCFLTDKPINRQTGN